MLNKDLGIPPKDDYTNLDALRDEGALDEASVAVLAEPNGLRNRLVHEYGHLDESLGIRSSVELAPKVAKVMEELRVWISEHD